jgi:hypothetical protein
MAGTGESFREYPSASGIPFRSLLTLLMAFSIEIHPSLQALVSG